jgi:hypothetical protein
MKNLIVLWLLMGIGITVASLNGLQLTHTAPIVLSDSVASQALFVCPYADSSFDGIAAGTLASHRLLSIIYMSLLLLWVGNLLWILYNSLLKDKFERKSWDLPIFLAKILIFSFMIGTVLMHSPNHFRRVSITGAGDKWVLCEKDTPGARAVQSAALSAHEK